MQPTTKDIFLPLHHQNTSSNHVVNHSDSVKTFVSTPVDNVSDNTSTGTDTSVMFKGSNEKQKKFDLRRRRQSISQNQDTSTKRNKMNIPTNLSMCADNDITKSLSKLIKAQVDMPTPTARLDTTDNACSTNTDIMGVVLHMEELDTIKTKNNEFVQICTTTLIDTSGTPMRLTLWGDFAITYVGPIKEAAKNQTMLLATHLTVSYFKGTYSVATTGFTEIYLDPYMQEEEKRAPQLVCNKIFYKQ